VDADPRTKELVFQKKTAAGKKKASS